MKWKTFCSFKR